MIKKLIAVSVVAMQVSILVAMGTKENELVNAVVKAGTSGDYSDKRPIVQRLINEGVDLKKVGALALKKWQNAGGHPNPQFFDVAQFILANGNLNPRDLDQLLGMSLINEANLNTGAYPINYGLEYLKLLLKYGANVNVPDEYHNTPLINAARLAGNNTSDTLYVLLKAGADKNAKDEHGKRAFDYANERTDRTKSPEQLYINPESEGFKLLAAN